MDFSPLGAFALGQASVLALAFIVFCIWAIAKGYMG